MNAVFPLSQLQHFAQQVFVQMGCSAADAHIATEVLLQADLRGIDSHGIARLTGYVRLHESGRVNATPNVHITYQTPSTAVVDGDKGLGLIVAPKAMQIAIDKAHAVGTGWVSVKNSNHFGIAGYHAMMALKHDMMGWAMTNASAIVAPTFSKSKMLGTNPIALAVPAGMQPPYVADFATTTAANGKLEILQRLQQNTPNGWVQTAEGLPSNDAAALKTGGALLPLGSDREHGSHKGYCLGSMVDILTGVLSGASYGPWAPPFPSYIPMPTNMPGEGLGHFLGAMRIDGFRPVQEFKDHMDNWINAFRNADPVNSNQPVLIPGDPERLMEYERRLYGIPVIQAVIDDLQALGKKMNIAL